MFFEEQKEWKQEIMKSLRHASVVLYCTFSWIKIILRKMYWRHFVAAILEL